MIEPGSKPPRVPLGQPALNRGAAELDRLSEITAEDVDAARALWERLAPDGYQELLNARSTRPQRKRGSA